jgi:hypothetical protein
MAITIGTIITARIVISAMPWLKPFIYQGRVIGMGGDEVVMVVDSYRPYLKVIHVKHIIDIRHT